MKYIIYLDLVSYGILCQCGNLFIDTFYEQIHKYWHSNKLSVHHAKYRNEVSYNLHPNKYVMKC